MKVVTDMSEGPPLGHPETPNLSPQTPISTPGEGTVIFPIHPTTHKKEDKNWKYQLTMGKYYQLCVGF